MFIGGEEMAGKLEIEVVPALSDNYVFMLFEPETGTSGVVDPAEAAPVVARLEAKGRGLDWILSTHHHSDHVGGNIELKQRFGCRIVGPRADRDRIPGIDVEVGEGETFELGAAKAKIFDTPGHTRGHISFWFEEAQALFCGDTLFAVGCGRLLEGDAPTMWASLSKLMALPDATKVYCGHEYTLSNARFARTVDPDNLALRQRLAHIEFDAGPQRADHPDHHRPGEGHQPLPSGRQPGHPSTARHGGGRATPRSSGRSAAGRMPPEPAVGASATWAPNRLPAVHAEDRTLI